MTQADSDSGNAEKSFSSSATASELSSMGIAHIERLAATQKEILGKLQQMNQDWFEHIQAETALASEFASKLAAAHSIPETTSICQEWTRRRMDKASEDAKRLLADSQKLIETGARLLPNGWPATSSGKSSTSA